MAITVYTTNIRPSSSVIGSLPLINPSAFSLGVYQWQTSSDLGLGSYICCIHLIAMVYILHNYIYIYIYIYIHTHTHTYHFDIYVASKDLTVDIY